MSKLKSDILILAAYLAPGENMTALDAGQTVRETVARICADKTTTPLTMALIACELAQHIDLMESVPKS